MHRRIVSTCAHLVQVTGMIDVKHELTCILNVTRRQVQGTVELCSKYIWGSSPKK